MQSIAKPFNPKILRLPNEVKTTIPISTSISSRIVSPIDELENKPINELASLK